MFCPACGAKNDLERAKCFVCDKILPHGQSSSSSDSRPRIARPQHVETPGSVGDRMLALLFDRILLAALALIVAALIASSWTAPRLSPTVLAILAAIGFLLLAFVYHLLGEALAGTTLGNAILGLYVRNEGDRGTFAAIAIRNALRVADGLGLYAVGFFVALFAPRHRRIGDLVAGAVVLADRVPPAARAALLVTFAALVGTSLWLAWQLCPACGADAVRVALR